MYRHHSDPPTIYKCSITCDGLSSDTFSEGKQIK